MQKHKVSRTTKTIVELSKVSIIVAKIRWILDFGLDSGLLVFSSTKGKAY